MGCLCCCFHVPHNEEHVESNSSNHGNCICLNCFTQNLKNKYGAFFGGVKMHAAAPSSFHEAASSSAMVAPNTMQFETSRNLTNNVNPQDSQSQNDSVDMGHGKGTSLSLRRNNVEISPNINSGVEKKNGSCCAEKSKECHKILSEKVESEVGLEDEDVCPTCLEEYTPENPKIIAQCQHNYHLSCIYEWKERSKNCPVCGKVMVFDETS